MLDVSKFAFPRPFVPETVQKILDPKTYGFNPAAFQEFLPAGAVTPAAFSEAVKDSLAKVPGYEAFAAFQACATEALVRDSQAAGEAWSAIARNQVALLEEVVSAAIDAITPAATTKPAARATAKASGARA